MAGLFLVSARNRDFADAAMAAARAQFARTGFTAAVDHSFPGWRLLHAPYIQGGPEGLFVDGDDFVAVAGTLVYDGLMGRPALEKLLGSIALPSPDWTRLDGQFVLLVRKAKRTFLLTDYFGAFQLFHDEPRRIFSTSLLSALDALPRVSFDPQGVYEFAFNVTPIGDDTVFAELKTLGPGEVIELGEDGVTRHAVAKPLPERVLDRPDEERLARHRQRLADLVRHHVAHFGDAVHCPLSGGLDSRLLFAALRALGCRPQLYVYGGPDSRDVRIARAVGEAIGVEVDWFDKEAFRTVSPDAFADQVERNFHDFDGLPNYGELFENGGNAAARDARHRGGAMSASGGCGEIFRNFFFLPDRPFTAAAVARTFFARYARGDATEAFDERRFLAAIETKILAALGRPGDRSTLPRPVIEQIYPRVRCRSLFGREISLEARHGAYLMPFLDARLVAEAMTLPLALKNAGRFEAKLLASIDPQLAAMPSAYGHDFAGTPAWRHRLSEWSTRIRPIGLRQRSYALRRRLGPVSDEHGGLLGRDHLGSVVDLDFPIMRRFFRTDGITDSGLLRRIANLEYLGEKLGSRLTG